MEIMKIRMTTQESLKQGLETGLLCQDDPDSPDEHHALLAHGSPTASLSPHWSCMSWVSLGDQRPGKSGQDKMINEDDAVRGEMGKRGETLEMPKAESSESQRSPNSLEMCGSLRPRGLEGL